MQGREESQMAVPFEEVLMEMPLKVDFMHIMKVGV